MAVDRSLDKLCRICISGGANNVGTVSVFSKEGESSGLLDKISRFLSIQISEEDRLPKVVCVDCETKLNSIEHFQSMALKSQETLHQLRKAYDENKEVDIDEFLSDNKNKSEWWTSSNETAGSGSDESEVDPASLVETTDHFKEEYSSKSLLHTILTKGQTLLANEVTEMEVTVDPMLFFEEEDDEEDDDERREVNPRSSAGNNNNLGVESSQAVSDPKPYQCYMCPRGFNSDLSLKSHLWNHIPSRKVLATSDLNRHETEGSLRTRMFNTQCLCTECGRVYPSKSTLRAHQITHSDLRPHKCSLCDKTFKRNQDLKFHINQHTGERPYRCPYCPKAFASSGNCFSHRKRMHPKQLARDKKKNRR